MSNIFIINNEQVENKEEKLVTELSYNLSDKELEEMYENYNKMKQNKFNTILTRKQFIDRVNNIKKKNQIQNEKKDSNMFLKNKYNSFKQNLNNNLSQRDILENHRLISQNNSLINNPNFQVPFHYKNLNDSMNSEEYLGIGESERQIILQKNNPKLESLKNIVNNKNMFNRINKLNANIPPMINNSNSNQNPNINQNKMIINKHLYEIEKNKIKEEFYLKKINQHNKKNIKIIILSNEIYYHTILSNYIYGLIIPNEKVIFANKILKQIDKTHDSMIIKSNNFNIDAWEKKFNNFNTYFIIIKSNSNMDTRYFNKDNIFVIDCQNMNEENIELNIQNTYRILYEMFKNKMELSKLGAYERVQAFYKLYKSALEKRKNYFNDFFHIVV